MIRAKRLLLILSLFITSACDTGFEQLGTSEHAIIFSALPTFVGGGIKNKVAQPGEKVFVMPWDTLYRVETSIQSIGWGGKGYGSSAEQDNYIETRSLDGNEVGLAITVQYQVNPEQLAHVVKSVGSSDESIRNLISLCARADIRTHMNVLRTRDFFDPELRRKAVEQVKEALATRLQEEGIIIHDVIYYDHRFERRLENNQIDRTYQEQIDQTQATNQETEQEQKKIVTVIERKKQEYNEALARVNRISEEADGYKNQAISRGESFFQAKKNEAEQILAIGMAEVEGLKKQIAALSGPGGKALLRLSVAQALVQQSPRFVLMNTSGGDKGIDLSRVDTNELMYQAGIFAGMSEGLKPGRSKDAVSQTAEPTKLLTPKNE